MQRLRSIRKESAERSEAKHERSEQQGIKDRPIILMKPKHKEHKLKHRFHVDLFFKAPLPGLNCEKP